MVRVPHMCSQADDPSQHVSDDTLRAALDAIEKAEREVIRLTGSGETWRVPAAPDRDSDLVLMDALSKARAALAASATDPDKVSARINPCKRPGCRCRYAASATEGRPDHCPGCDGNHA